MNPQTYSAIAMTMTRDRNYNRNGKEILKKGGKVIIKIDECKNMVKELFYVQREKEVGEEQ
jgi:hypothetical protein